MEDNFKEELRERINTNIYRVIIEINNLVARGNYNEAKKRLDAIREILQERENIDFEDIGIHRLVYNLDQALEFSMVLASRGDDGIGAEEERFNFLKQERADLLDEEVARVEFEIHELEERRERLETSQTEEIELEGVSVDVIRRRIEELRKNNEGIEQNQVDFIIEELENLLGKADETGHISIEDINKAISQLRTSAERARTEEAVSVEESEEETTVTDEIDEIIRNYLHSESRESFESSFTQEIEEELHLIKEIKGRRNFSVKKKDRNDAYEREESDEEIERFIRETSGEDEIIRIDSEIKFLQEEMQKITQEISSLTSESEDLEKLKEALKITLKDYRTTDEKISELKEKLKKLQEKGPISEEERASADFKEFAKQQERMPKSEAVLKNRYIEYIEQKILDLRIKKTEVHQEVISVKIEEIRKKQKKIITELKSKVTEKEKRKEIEELEVSIETKRKSKIADEIAQKKAKKQRIFAHKKADFIEAKKEEIIIKIKARLEVEESVERRETLEKLIEEIRQIKTTNRKTKKKTTIKPKDSKNKTVDLAISELESVLRQSKKYKIVRTHQDFEELIERRQSLQRYIISRIKKPNEMYFPYSEFYDYQIQIPEDPDEMRNIAEYQGRHEPDIEEEYQRRKDDMYAKYYGDRKYRREYAKRAKRYFSHVDDVEGYDDLDFEYQTVRQYGEREEDEKFLLLDRYKECLERSTRYESGDTSVYKGTPEEIDMQYQKDRIYVETRNHTFDQNEYTRRDLGTIGKYGEKMPYIPRQKGILKNAGRVVLNGGILVRNIVSPVYRGIGKLVAQPVHRLIKGDRDASPYRNNLYHRMVARREYFEEKAKQRDEEATRELQEETGENTEVKPVRHPIKNYITSRFNAIFKYKEGNEAVLRAGSADIRRNIVEQKGTVIYCDILRANISELREQIEFLEGELRNHPDSRNADEAREALQQKKDKLELEQSKLKETAEEVLETEQTDAISDSQHSKASKEVVTIGATVIKGFATGLAIKYVGPRIEKWLAERTKIPQEVETVTQVPETKRTFVDATYKTETVPVYEERFATSSTMKNIVAQNTGKRVTGYYSVYGGEKRPFTYTLSDKDRITAIFQADGKKGIGLSDASGMKAPRLTNRSFDSSFLDGRGVLRQDISLEDAIQALGSTTDSKTLSGLYVSIGDKYWVKASDLMQGIVDKVKVGEKVSSVIDVPAHIEEVTTMVDRITRTTAMVDNERALRALRTLANAGKIAVLADGSINMTELLRNTHSSVQNNKRKERRYEYDDGDIVPTSRKEYKRMSREEKAERE